MAIFLCRVYWVTYSTTQCALLLYIRKIQSEALRWLPPPLRMSLHNYVDIEARVYSLQKISDIQLGMHVKRRPSMKWELEYETVDGKQRRKERTVISKVYDIKGIKWNLFICQIQTLRGTLWGEQDMREIDGWKICVWLFGTDFRAFSFLIKLSILCTCKVTSRKTEMEFM